MSKRYKKGFPNSTVDAFHHDGDVKIVKATVEHAGYLQHHLRPADIRECNIHGATPWRALHLPLRYKDAETYTGMYKDVPACMFGVVPYGTDDDLSYGSIWLLGTSVLDEQSRKFLTASKSMSDWLCDRYDFVENVVPLDHIHTIRWLNWLGFSFSESPTNINGFSCLRFVRCQRAIEVRFE